MPPLRSTATGLAACALLLAAPAAPPAPGDSERSQAARAELDALRDKIDRIRERIARDQSQRSDLASRLAAAEARISAADKRLRTLDADIEKTRRRVANLSDRRDAERDRLTGELDALRAQVRAAYASGRLDRMRLLLSGESPEKLGRMLVYYEYFADAQTAQVDKLRAALTDLAVRQKALDREQQALARRRGERAQTLADLQASQDKRRATMAALDKRLSAGKASLEDMRADAARLKKLLGNLQDQLADLPPLEPGGTSFAKLKGRMTPPVAGRVLAGFGARKGSGPLRWQGEWLAAPDGAPVKAVAGGRIVYVGYMHRYGLIVIIDHGHGYYSLYGHAQSSYVSVGDRVRRGQTIAQAGRSGGHSRSGVYLEIRKGQTAVDPARWLSG